MTKAIELDKDLIYLLYYNMKMGAVKIGNILGVSDGLIYKKMNIWGFKRRSKSESNKGRKLTEKHKENIREGLRLEVNKEQLYNLYYNERKSAEQVGNILGVSKRTILRRMNECGFERRQDFNGSNNPAWKGDDVSYKGVHKWIRENIPIPKNCKYCGKECRVELSSNNEIYDRDINNYEWLCHRCHTRKDRGCDLNE